MTEADAQQTSTTPIVEPLRGEAIVEWVKSNEVKPFRYQPNNVGLWVLIVGGVITGAMAIWLYFRSGLALPIHFAGFGVLLGVSFWQWIVVIRWYGRLVGSYVLLSETEMLVGAGKKAWLVQRNRLTRDHIFVDNMQKNRITMVLPLRVEGWSYDIHLVGPFMNMKELQTFIAEIVSQLMIDEDAAAQSDVEGDDDVGGNGDSANAIAVTSAPRPAKRKKKRSSQKGGR